MSAVFERADIERFRNIVGQELGLRFEDDKLESLADILRERMDALGCSRFGAYESHLRGRGRGEVRALSGRLTVAETYFFRYWDHFRAFTEVVLPERARALSDRRRLRILSAGCASGEEAYSLAILVRDHLPDRESWDVKILGIDVNPSMIEKASRGRYSRWSLRETPAEAQARNFRSDGGQFELDETVRAMVTFEERNLVDEDPLFWQALTFDVVFCRNVLMYFTLDTARDVVRRIVRALVPNGFLFLGHAETLRGLTQDFRLCHTHDTFYYRRNDDSVAVVAKAAEAAACAEPAALSLPPDVESTVSRVDVVERAPKRIATLADCGSPAPSIAARTCDLRPVLEAMRLERFSAALELIRELPAESDGDPDALLLRAVLLTNNGMLDESEEVCRRLLAVDEFNAGAHYLMALCREHAGDPNGAVDQGQIAISLDAGFAMPHFHLGIMARRLGDTATAQREFGLALSLFGREDAARLVLFGGGFSRETLLQLSRTELRAAGGEA